MAYAMGYMMSPLTGLRKDRPNDDPRVSQPESVLESFPLKVDFRVHAFA